jgi:hypothetical protein
MPTRRYVPRSFFVNDLDFGVPDKELKIKPASAWRPGSTEDYARASSMQHHIAQAMNERIEVLYPTRKAFAEGARLDYERLGRVLRGEYVMRLEDIGMAERLLGLSIRLIAERPQRPTT